MPTQHRLGSILRNLGYVRNSKTSEWKKVLNSAPTNGINDSELLCSNDLKGMTEVGLSINTNTLKPICSNDLDSSTEVASLKAKIDQLNKQLLELEQTSNNNKEFTVKLNHKNLELKQENTKLLNINLEQANKIKELENESRFSYNSGLTLKNKATPVVEVATKKYIPDEH